MTTQIFFAIPPFPTPPSLGLLVSRRKIRSVISQALATSVRLVHSLSAWFLEMSGSTDFFIYFFCCDACLRFIIHLLRARVGINVVLGFWIVGPLLPPVTRFFFLPLGAGLGQAGFYWGTGRRHTMFLFAYISRPGKGSGNSAIVT